MASILTQRDLMVSLKKETCLNILRLNKLQTIPSELARQVFKENALEKPTQNLFNHLAHYLVSIIDSQLTASFTWPLYDTKAERAYRSELSSFISDYSNKGLLSPVMSSYLVNPGCYKVTLLTFQLSQLAVHKLLLTGMNKERQRKLYDNMTEKYKSQEKEGFIEAIDKETVTILRKFDNYIYKRQVMENIGAKFRERITSMQNKMSALNPQKFIDDIIDEYLKNRVLDEDFKAKIIEIKNVQKPAEIFDIWLTYADERIEEMESKWNEKVCPFLQTCQEAQTCAEALVIRQTGEMDRNSYVIEYNPQTDDICTKELQSNVNSEQKYVLKNIIKDERLSFPNLIRGYVIAICYIFKNLNIGDEIFKFNDYLDSGCENYRELVSAMTSLMERILNAESKLQSSPIMYDQSVSLKDFSDIPPLPDLSDLRTHKEMLCQTLFEPFTPQSVSKHQFNLRRKTSIGAFAKPDMKSFIAPFHQPRDAFLRTIISCRASSYDHSNVTHNFHNMSLMPQANTRANETIAECSSGFTKHQILRLLSTKKSSSSKKFKYKTERPDINIKKGGLFNESTTSNESNGLFRSYSSPNLFENKEHRPRSKHGRKKLSVMQEDSPSLLEVSGIVALDSDSNSGTPVRKFGSRERMGATSLPVISITPEPDTKLQEMLKDIDIDLNKEISMEKVPASDEEAKTDTPKTNAQLIRKTSSLEKIINRFKKVRANVIPMDSVESNEFRTIVEEKENMNVNIDVTANRVLLPDLLSPSCSVLTNNSTDYLDQICMNMDEKVRRKPRESLGTALGVDQTFLDQFDLID